MTLYFYDTEFVEDGTTIDLISIAFVCEDGRELYLHVDGYDRDKAYRHEFVGQHVMPYLDGKPTTPRDDAARQIAAFIQPGADLWGYFPSYDHVALAQLYGTMMDLPNHIPMRTNCIAQLAQMGRVGRIPVPNDAAHDALADARWTRDAFHWLLQHGGR